MDSLLIQILNNIIAEYDFPQLHNQFLTSESDGTLVQFSQGNSILYFNIRKYEIDMQLIYYGNKPIGYPVSRLIDHGIDWIDLNTPNEDFTKLHQLLQKLK